MRAVTCFMILVGAAASVVFAAQAPGVSPAAVQASSAPVQVTSGALQISSAPMRITLAPPRAAPTASPSNTSATQNVLPAAPVEDHGPLRGYRRVVAYGKEQYCRNDLATGSHVARNPACLTYEQLQAEQARAEKFVWGVQDKPIIPTLSNGGLMRGP